MRIIIHKIMENYARMLIDFVPVRKHLIWQVLEFIGEDALNTRETLKIVHFIRNELDIGMKEFFDWMASKGWKMNDELMELKRKWKNKERKAKKYSGGTGAGGSRSSSAASSISPTRAASASGSDDEQVRQMKQSNGNHNSNRAPSAASSSSSSSPPYAGRTWSAGVSDGKKPSLNLRKASSHQRQNNEDEEDDDEGDGDTGGDDDDDDGGGGEIAVGRSRFSQGKARISSERQSYQNLGPSLVSSHPAASPIAKRGL